MSAMEILTASMNNEVVDVVENIDIMGTIYIFSDIVVCEDIYIKPDANVHVIMYIESVD